MKNTEPKPSVFSPHIFLAFHHGDEHLERPQSKSRPGPTSTTAAASVRGQSARRFKISLIVQGPIAKVLIENAFPA
jgi:hypothetical protein